MPKKDRQDLPNHFEKLPLTVTQASDNLGCVRLAAALWQEELAPTGRSATSPTSNLSQNHRHTPPNNTPFTNSKKLRVFAPSR